MPENTPVFKGINISPNSKVVGQSGERGPASATFGNTDFGESKFDAKNLPSEEILGGQYQSIRGELQGASDKWANGLTKMVGIAGTSVAENTLGLIYGLGASALSGDSSKLYDNDFSRSLDEINGFLQKEMPNYYSDREKEYSLLEGLGTSNFWSDKFLSGAGYALGAYATGAGLGKFASLGKLARAGKTLEGVEDISKAAKFTKIADAADFGKNAALMSFGESAVEARGIKDETTQKLIADYKEKYKKDPDEAAMKAINDLADAAGNWGLATNLVITGLSNAIQFPKMLSKGYTANKIALNEIELQGGKYIAKNKSAMEGTIGSLLEGVIAEGGQEQAQLATQKTLSDYYSRGFKDKKDQHSLVESLTYGMKEAFGTKEGWESFLLGALLGGPTAIAQNETAEKNRNTTQVAAMLNTNEAKKTLKSFENFVRYSSYEQDKNTALKAGNKFDYLNAEFNQNKSFVKDYIDKGATDLLVQQYEDMKQMDDEEFKKVAGYPENEALPKSKTEIIQDNINLIKELDKTDRDIKTVFPYDRTKFTPEEYQVAVDNLWHFSTSIKNLDKRKKELDNELFKIAAENTIEGIDNPLLKKQAELINSDLEKIKVLKTALAESYNKLANPSTTKKAVGEIVETANKEAKDTNPVSEAEEPSAFKNYSDEELVSSIQQLEEEYKTTKETDQAEETEIFLEEAKKELATRSTKFKKAETEANKASVEYKGKTVEGQLYTSPKGDTFIKYKEGNKTTHIPVTKNEDGTYSIIEKQPTEVTKDSVAELQDIVSKTIADPLESNSEDSQIIQNSVENDADGIAVVDTRYKARLGSTVPGIVMMHQFWHNFKEIATLDGRKIFKFNFIKDDNGFPEVDNTTKINTSLVNDPTSLKEGSKVIYRITELPKEVQQESDIEVRKISENHGGLTRGFYENIGIYTESGDLIGFYPLPHNIDDNLSKNIPALLAARDENIRIRLSILDRIEKGEEASSEIFSKGQGTLYTKTKDGKLDFTDNSGNTRSIFNEAEIRDIDKVNSTAVFAFSDGESLILPPGLPKRDTESIEEALQGFGNWGRKGQIFMLVKSANNTWYPVPIYANKVTPEVATRVTEILKDPALDTAAITQVLNPFIYTTYNEDRRGAVLVSKDQAGFVTFKVKGKYYSLSGIADGTEEKEFKQALQELNQNIDISTINTKQGQETLKNNKTLTTNAWTYEGNYLVQPYIRVTKLPEFKVKEIEVEGVTEKVFTLADLGITEPTGDFGMEDFGIDKPKFTVQKEFKEEDIPQLKSWIKNNLPQFNLSVKDFSKVKGLSPNSYGQYRNLVLFINTYAPRGTGYHEAFHGVFRALLDEQEQSEIMTEAKKRYEAPSEKDLATLEAHYKNEYNKDLNKQQLSDLYYEEKLADEFAEYSESYEERSIPQRIKDFFKKILNWFNLFTNSDQSKVDKLFESVNRGDYKSKKPLFISDKFEPVDKKIPGFKTDLQNAVVASIGGQYINKLFTRAAEGETIGDIRASSMFSEIINDYKKFIETSTSDIEKQVTARILSEFGMFKDEVFKYLKERGINTKEDFTIKHGNIDGALKGDVEIIATEDKTSKGYGEWTSIPGFKTASPRLKLFLSDIQALDAEGKPKTFLGKPVYVDMVDLYYYLEDNLIGLYTLQEQKEEMERLAVSRPDIQNVIDKLFLQSGNISKEEIERMQNDFKTNFSKQLLGYTLVKFNTDHKTKTTTFEIIEANRQNFGREIYNEWSDNLIDPNRSTVVEHKLAQEPKVHNTEASLQLLKRANGLLEQTVVKRDKSGKALTSTFNPDFDTVNEMFLKVGIEFNPAVLRKNLKDPELYRAFRDYVEWLAAEQPESKEKNAKKALSVLASYQVKGMYKGYTTSFNNVENEAVYAIQMPNFQSRLFAKLTGDNYDTAIAELKRDNFYKNNLLLNDLNNTTFREENFKFTVLDGLKNGKSNTPGLKFSSMTDKDFFASQIALFLNQSANKAKEGTTSIATSKLTYLIPADKNMLYVYDIIKRNFAITKENEINPGSASLELFVNAAISEVERMKQAFQTKRDFADGKIGIEKLYAHYHYTEKNAELSKENPDADKLFDGQAFKFNYFRNLNDKSLLTQIRDEISTDGEISEDTRVEIKKHIIAELNTVIQRDIAIATDLGLDNNNLNTQERFESVIANYSLNQFLYNIELSKLLNGDGAFYKPGDLAKRTPQSGAFITNNNTKPNSTMNVLVVKDIKQATKSGAALTEMGFPALAEEYNSVEYTDAQLYIMPEKARQMRLERGDWYQQDEEAYKIGEGIIKPERISEDIRQRLAAYKTFTYGNRFDENLGIYVVDQIKCSMMTAYKIMEDINPLMKELREKSKEHNIDMIAYGTTFKAAMPFRESIEDIKGNATLSIPSENFGFQQDNPNHLLDEANDSLRQVTMLLPALVRDEAKRQLLLDIQAANIYTDRTDLKEELENYKDFGRLVEESLTKRQVTENVSKALEMLPNGKFRVGLDTGTTSVQAENLISSLYTNNIIKQKFKGGSAVQATALGFKFKGLQDQQEAIEKSEELSKIQTDLEYKYNKDNKSLEYVECALPAWASEFFDTNGFLKSDVPDDLKQLFCYRIPTEGAHSMLPLKVVKFLPEVIGNYIILPFEITKQFGADFDFDKVYFITPEFEKAKDGTLSKVKYDDTKSPSENSRKARNNKILDIYIETLQDPENLEMVMTPSGFTDLTNFVKDTLKITSIDKGNYYWASTQRDLRARNHIAAALKGQTNLHVTGHAYATLMELDSQTTNSSGEPTMDGTIKFDHKESTNFSNKYSINGNYISDELGQVLAASLDDIKNPIMYYLNINTTTVDVWATIVRAGFGIQTASNFMTQPALLELSKKLSGNKEQIRNLDAKRLSVRDLTLAYKANIKQVREELSDSALNSLKEKEGSENWSNINTDEMNRWREFGNKKSNLTISKDSEEHNLQLLDYLTGQVRILNQYEKFDKIAKGLVEINKFFGINKEVGPNMENIISQQDRYNIITSDAFAIKGFNISKIQVIDETWEAQRDALDFLGTHFPYNSNLYNSVKNDVAKSLIKHTAISKAEDESEVALEAQTLKNKLKPEDRMTINGFVGAFLGQKDKSSFFSSLTREEQKRLLKEVPKKFTELSATTLKSNLFLKNLKTQLDKKSSTVFLQIRGNRLDISKKNSITDSFMDIYNDPKTRPFAEDLLKYSYIYSGMFTGLNSFHTMIPIEILENYGWTQFKQRMLTVLNDDSYYLTIEEKRRLKDQLIRNFPDKFIKIIENSFTDAKNPLPAVLTVDINADNKDKFSSIILDTYDSEEGEEYKLADYFKVFDNVRKDFSIFRRVGESSYEKVDALGRAGRMVEIDPNNDIKTSILREKSLPLAEEPNDYTEGVEEEPETPVIEEETKDLDNNNRAALEDIFGIILPEHEEGVEPEVKPEDIDNLPPIEPC